MPESNALNNFPQNTQKFLKRLSRNNSRKWFEEHRDEYVSEFLEPAMHFVVEMGEKLSVIVPGIAAVPKIDKSIFRLHRDVRFSKDKSPYKTNLGIYLWEGKRKMNSPGFYFHIDTKGFFIGSGMYMFSKENLKKYRDAVADSSSGKELLNAVKKVEKKGDYQWGGKKYKRIPKDYDPDSKYAGYLLHDSLYVYTESKDIDALIKNEPIEYSFEIFKNMLPVHRWLVKYVS